MAGRLRGGKPTPPSASTCLNVLEARTPGEGRTAGAPGLRPRWENVVPLSPPTGRRSPVLALEWGGDGAGGQRSRGRAQVELRGTESEQSLPRGPWRLFVQGQAEGHSMRETKPRGRQLQKGGAHCPPSAPDAGPLLVSASWPAVGGVPPPGTTVTLGSVLDALTSALCTLGQDRN